MLPIFICLLGALYVVDGHAAAVNVDIPSFQAQPTPGGKIALLVGVRKYHPNSGIRALQYADKDMQRLQKVLEQHGYKVELLVNENATRGEILSALRFMPNRLKDPKNSTVIFAFSGHGLALKEQNYLVTYDTYAKQPELVDIPDNALLLSQVMQLIRETGAKQQLMWLDACRNNLLENGKDIDIGTNGGMRAVSSKDAQGLMILFSSEQGMRSYEDNKLEAGIFSHFLIQGLTGANGQTLDADGWIRMDKLRIYVENQVSTYALETRRVQVPYIGGEFHGQFWVGQVAPPRPPEPPFYEPRLLPLTVRSNVPNGQDQVFIDGELQGSTKLVANLPLGIHQVRIVADGYVPWEQQVELTQPYSVYAKLDAAAPKPGQTMRDCDYCPEMVAIPAGSFAMGSTVYDSEQPVHTVHIKAFQMGKYEVTNAQFRKFRPEHNSGEYEGHSLNGDNQPVVNVSWADAVAYTEWLAKETGKPYRLPSEAEWEYAARAGTTTARFWGDNPDQACSYANVHDKTSKQQLDFSWTYHDCNDGYAVSAPVGSYSPNPWGLYDILGNVWEWNADKWHDNYNDAPTDGSAWESGGSSGRLLRGCSWFDNPDNCRAAYRDLNSNPDDYDGFRVVFRVAGRAF